MRRPPANAGFTIVEVMLAVAILVTLTSLMWISIANMFTMRDVIETRAERYQQVRVTLNRMAKEVSTAYMGGPQFGAEELPGEETFGVPAAEDDDEAALLAATGQEEIQLGMIGRKAELSFSSFAHVRTNNRERASEHAEIGYFVRTERDAADGRMVKKLMRREDVSTDDDLTSGGVIYTMLPEVEAVEFEYWDPGVAELGTFEEIAQGRWVSEWNTTRREFAGRLPTRVRITLVLPPQGQSERPETFVTQTQVQVTEVLEF